ncbi:alpha-glycosidase [Clostridium sp. CF011]|uniref:alpha-glycosidase n=1 Tax=unclassified Clostridium TaxID=2614128 RepID=UPI001C0C1DF1|nr:MULTISPECIES: alpha-glycosidase [unclassified Clostridium]MBU3093207.1 alpha-glycosidase [Clostridium sp. CF011]MBW9144730.1 alpha-glycosidase [Clostridium sp. CM027]UVE40520.1 alpha-glycosidase [Clostridium sp. CM027]WAG69480.1 alpha-glycosidase [Clostridium sp. CF011]
MNKHAIYHITETPYAYGRDLNTLVLRLRTAKDDVKKCNLYYKDRYNWDDPYDVKEMKITAQADLFDYFETEVSVERNRYRYYFELIDWDNNIICFDERGFRDKTTDLKEITAFQFAYLAEGDLYEEAPWLQESVVYQIFPDRFYNGDKSNDQENTSKWGSVVNTESMFGGTIKGVIDKLDYLEELGVNLVYLTPIFKSTSNHKYNTADYYGIDPQFGTLDTAKELIKKCHEKGMKIIFDAVFNHSGSDFFAFEDLLDKQEASKYKDWYFIDSYPVSTDTVNYYTFADDVSTMPKLNTHNSEVREYLLKVGEYWVKEIGIDGWRLDVCDEVDHDFWRAFSKVVKAANKDAVIVGEIMHEANSFLKGDQLDSIMNYPFKSALVDFFANRSIAAEEFDNILSSNRTLYMSSITRQLWNLMGSHDTKRFLTECEDNVDRMKLAIAFQFCYQGVPYIYYGDEIGLNGGEDPQCRKCMIWDVEKQNIELFNHYKTMISLRKNNSALIYGGYKKLYCKDNVLVFERSYEGDSLLIAINNSDEEYNVKLSLDNTAIDIFTSQETKLNNGLILDPMEFKILKL